MKKWINTYLLPVTISAVVGFLAGEEFMARYLEKEIPKMIKKRFKEPPNVYILDSKDSE